ncbi:MAG: hypothetical protein ISEC1_P0647 [Thiomicrorhabdus sp.]|nr:MAG: hypothetical protein ISEC1_P0647 [Thiomicrorhabdus sp.]
MSLESIALLGLPGSGKSRIEQALLESQASQTADNIILAQNVKVVEVSGQIIQGKQADQSFDLVLCILDVRSTLLAGRDDWLEVQLKEMLAASHAVIYNFLEASSLDEQSWWGRWIKINAPELSVFRVLNGVLPDSLFSLFSSFEQGGYPPKKLPQQAWQNFEFEVGCISLDHLLFGLDSSKQNLGMKIARVTGVVETLEYDNLVTLEGSALRWDMFAAKQSAASGVITIQGQALDQAWLEELIKASLV